MTSDVLYFGMVTRRIPVRTIVDKDLRDAYELRFGGYASLSWLMETAIRSTLEASAGNPTFADQVKAAIKAHVTQLKHQPRAQDVRDLAGPT